MNTAEKKLEFPVAGNLPDIYRVPTLRYPVSFRQLAFVRKTISDFRLLDISG